MFQQALTLMSQRCVSVAPTATAQRATLPSPDHHSQDTFENPMLRPPPFTAHPFKPRSRNCLITGGHPVKSVLHTTSMHHEPGYVRGASRFSKRFIYVNKKQCTPMTPLKAWRGFTGNIYFEPIKVKAVTQLPPRPPTEVSITRGCTYNGRSLDDTTFGATHETSLESDLVSTYQSLPETSVPNMKQVVKGAQSVFPSRNTPNYAAQLDYLLVPADVELLIGGSLPIRGNYQQGTKTNNLEMRKALQPLVTMKRPDVHIIEPTTENLKQKFHYNRAKICRGSVVLRCSQMKDKQIIGNGYLAASDTRECTADQTSTNTNLNVVISGFTEDDSNAKLPPLSNVPHIKRSNCKTLERVFENSAQLKQSMPYVKFSKVIEQPK